MERLALAAVGLIGLAGTSPAQTLLHTFHGDSAVDTFGWFVDGVGDLDGDGFDDVIVGSKYDDPNGPDSGSASVLSGRDGSLIRFLAGDGPGDEFGWMVRGVGDMTGDGIGDVAVGAPYDDDNGPDSGRLRVFSGADWSVVHTFDGDAAGDNFGFSAGAAGDVDADGWPDVIVGAPLADGGGTDAGRVRVFSGQGGAVLHTFDGDSESDWMGWMVDGAGHVDGDGHADVVTGAFRDDVDGHHDAGTAYVFAGVDGSAIHVWHGDGGGDELGAWVSGLGDVNGDGRDDVLVAAPQDDLPLLDSGSAFVFSGLDGSVLYSVAGDDPVDWMGWAVAGVGDANGDGFPDALISALRDDHGGLDSGSAHLVSGPDGAPLARFDGDDPLDLFSFGIGGAGDVNGDGYADLLASGPYDSSFGDQAGLARVYAGLGPVQAFGEGCHGPRARWLGAPSIGSDDFAVTVLDAAPGAPAYFGLGLSNSDWAGVPLPFDAAPLGAPGCSILISGDAVFVSATDASGAGSMTYPVPNDNGLVGTVLYGQVSVIAPGFNPAGLTFANGLEIRLVP